MVRRLCLGKLTCTRFAAADVRARQPLVRRKKRGNGLKLPAVDRPVAPILASPTASDAHSGLENGGQCLHVHAPTCRYSAATHADAVRSSRDVYVSCTTQHPTHAGPALVGAETSTADTHV